MSFPTAPAGFTPPQPSPSNWGQPNLNASPLTPDMRQARMDWRTALNSWQDQRPTPQSLFPDFGGGQPTPDMRNQFQQARTDWQNAMPQMPAGMAALMPPQLQQHVARQMGWISGQPQPSPMAVPPMSAPIV